MDTELQITFRGMASSELLRDLIRQKLDKALRFRASAANCRVVVERSFSAQLKGALVRVHVTLYGLARGTQIIVSARHQDASAAVREAFERIQRKASDVPAVVARRAAPRVQLPMS